MRTPSPDPRTRPGSGLSCALALLALLALLSVPGPSAAQEEPAPPPRGLADSFLIEMAGGTVGSLAGLGLGIAVGRPHDCGSDDLECIFQGLAVALVTSTVGAGGGAYAAGCWQDTDPSGWGAALGSAAGAAAGIGMIKLLEESTRGGGEGFTAVLAYTLTQGLVTAVFTRLF